MPNTQTPARDTQAVYTQLMVSDAYTVYIHIIIVLEVMEHTSVQSVCKSSYWERALVVRSGVEPW